MKRILTTLTCLLLLAGCQTTPIVENEFLENANFNKIKTYAFAPQLSGQNMPAQMGPKAIKAIKTSIEERFALLGYTVASPKEADIIVSYRANLLRVNNNNIDSINGNIGFYRNRAFYVLNYNPNIDDRDERTLIIDIYKNKDNNPELIWRGYTTKKFFTNTKSKPEETRLHISEIMKHFPPTPEK